MRCSHPRTISYDRYLELGGEPVEPAPIGITGSDVIGWFVCLDCSVLSDDLIELRSGNWPCLEALNARPRVASRPDEAGPAGQQRLAV